jgi:hypothetical protein
MPAIASLAPACQAVAARITDALMWRCQAARKWLWQCATVIVFHRRLESAIAGPNPRGLSIEIIRPDNVDLLKPLVGARRTDTFRSHLARGWAGAMGLIDGRAVNYHWALKGPAHATLLEPSLTMPVAEGQAYLLVEFTAPMFRGRRIAGAARSCLMNRLLNHHGVRDFLIAVDRRNGRNVRSVRRMGFSPYLSYRVVQAGPYRRTMPRRLRPDWMGV